MHIDDMCLHTKYEPCNQVSLGVMEKYQVFILNLCRRMGGQTDGRTEDRWTTVKQYAPDLSIQGHKKKNKRANMALDCSPNWPSGSGGDV